MGVSGRKINPDELANDAVLREIGEELTVEIKSVSR